MGYLISVILIVFSLGLHELFAGKVVAAEGSETASRLLYVRGLDDVRSLDDVVNNKVAKLFFLSLAIGHRVLSGP